MDYQCSTVGQGIGSGRTGSVNPRHTRTNGLVKRLKKLKNFIPSVDSLPVVYTMFDENGNPYNGTRREYLYDFISDAVSKMSELVVTENMTSAKVIDGLVEKLSEFTKEHARDDELKRDIGFVITGLKTQTVTSRSRVLDIESFEDFESKLYQEIKDYLGN